MTSSLSSPTQAPHLSGTVELLLRLWTQPELHAVASFGWTDETPVIRMIRQAVLLGGGTPDPVPADLLRAHFHDEFQAATTARRLQALVTGFTSVAGQPILAASVGILDHGPSSEDASRGSQSDALQSYLQQRAQPAQILFSCSRPISSALPSALRVRKLGLLNVAGREDLDLYELLWNYKEQAAAAAVQARARGVQQRQTTTLPVQPTLTAPKIRQVPARYEKVLSALSVTRQQCKALFSRLVLLYRKRVSSLSWPSRIPWASRLRGRPAQFTGLGICVAAGAVFFLLHHRSSTTSQPAIPTQIPPAPTQTAPPPSVVEKPPADTTVPAEKSLKNRKLDPSKQAHAADEDKSAKGRGTLSSEQTRQVLNRGQAELDRGCYTRAIGYYRRVLDDDPRNASASSGIEKARTRMRLSGDDPQGHCQ